MSSSSSLSTSVSSISSKTTTLFFVYAPFETPVLAHSTRLVEEERRLTSIGRFSGIVLGEDDSESDELGYCPEDSERMQKMVGSIMICEARTVKEVRDKIKADRHLDQDIWRPETLVILPFHSSSYLP